MCDSPFYVQNPKYPHASQEREIPVPCGRCPVCQNRRVSQWAFRLLQEEKNFKTSFFVTLTYDTRFVPISKKGYMTLDKSDLQKFFKRLRKKLKKDEKIKYYAAGEYGGKTYRPHYHIILFGSDPDRIVQAWSIDNVPLGMVHVGQVTSASVAYTLKYINKGKLIPIHQNDDRIPEFALMSKGMGSNYLTNQIIEHHREKFINYLTLEGGFKVSMPKYYKERLWTKKETDWINFNTKKYIEENQQKEIANFEQNVYTSQSFDQFKEGQKIYRLKKFRKNGKLRGDL